MLLRISFFYILVLCLSFTQLDAAKILAVFPTQSPSHYILVTPLLQELARRGHEVTSITPYPQKKPLKNFRDIVVLQDYKEFLDKVQNNQDMHDMSLWESFDFIFMMGTGMSRSVLQQPEIKKLLADPTETFDLLIVDVCVDEALFGFAAHFRAAAIGVAPFGQSLWSMELTGAPMLPSYMPHYLLSTSEEMTFLERVNNFYTYFAEYYFYKFRYLPALHEIYMQHFAHTGQTLEDVRRNFSLVLVNQHSSLGAVQPYLPNMVEVGGMQVSPHGRPLSAELQTFLDGAAEGAIYFSLGSNIKSENMSPEKLSAIIDCLRSLPQRVLWKFDAPNLSHLASTNVLVRSWFPQADILAHPNVKLFITHGGLLSTTESMARGKPVLGIPMFGDQRMNMKRSKSMGLGLTLDYNDLSESRLRAVIRELLSNTSYAQTAQAISRRYHDKPLTALQTAIFWVEYVLRHNGAHHLRCAGMKLNILQYFGLDVFALMIALFLLVLVLIGVAGRGLYMFLLSGRRTLESQQKELYRKKVN